MFSVLTTVYYIPSYVQSMFDCLILPNMLIFMERSCQPASCTSTFFDLQYLGIDWGMILKWFLKIQVGWGGLDSPDKCQAAVNKMMNLHFPKMLGISCLDEELREISFFDFQLRPSPRSLKTETEKATFWMRNLFNIYFCVCFWNSSQRTNCISETRALKWRNISVKFNDSFLVHQIKLVTQL